jgi:hypothetical protein
MLNVHKDPAASLYMLVVLNLLIHTINCSISCRVPRYLKRSDSPTHSLYFIYTIYTSLESY